MRKNKKLLLASVAAMGALALGVGATSTFAWYQATTTAVKLVSSAENQTIDVEKPASITTTVGDITVVLSFERVDTAGKNDEDPQFAGKALKPVEYGKLYEKSADHSEQEFIEYTDDDYGTFYPSPASGYAVTTGWHYAIKGVDGSSLYYDAAADAYSTYVGSNYDNFAIYKCKWSANYTADQRVQFAADHPDGMESEVTFSKKSDAHASTGFWTAVDRPTAQTATPDETEVALTLSIATLTGTSANGVYGYVMVFSHGTNVTNDVTVGVTATPDDFEDISA